MFTNIFLFPKSASITSWDDYQLTQPVGQRAPTLEQIDGMTSALVCSSYFDELSQYNINPPVYAGDAATVQSCVDAALADASANSGVLSWAGQGSFAGCEQASGGNPSGQVNIFLAPGMKAAASPFDGADLCKKDSAYHSGNLGAPNFSLIPTDHSCNASAGDVLHGLSHEMVELVSDPALFGWVHTEDLLNPMQNYAEGELADICSSVGAYPSPPGDAGEIAFPVTADLQNLGLAGLKVAPYWSDQDAACEPTAIMNDTLVPIGGSPSIRFTGSVHNLDIPFTQTSPPSGTLDSLELDIATGGDDLRGNSAANVIVEVKVGGKLIDLQKNAVNEGTSWANDSLHAVLLNFPPGITVSQVKKVTLNTQFDGGIGGDNWDVDGVMLQAAVVESSGGCTPRVAQLVDATGSNHFDDGHQGLVRLKGGSLQTFTIPTASVATSQRDLTVTGLYLTIGTGDDDLRGGNDVQDNVAGVVSLTTGASATFANLNRDANWPNQTTSPPIELFKINALPPQTTAGQLLSFGLQSNFPGGLSGDNWDVTSIQMFATLGCPATPPTTRVTQTLVDSSGSPLCRLTGTDRECSIAIPPPAGFDSTDIVDALTLTIATGDDDLRGGSFPEDNADVVIGGQQFKNVNQFQSFPNSSIETIPLVPQPTALSNVANLDVKTNFGGGLGGDNWNINRLTLQATIETGAAASARVSAPAASIRPATEPTRAAPASIRSTGSNHAQPDVSGPSPWTLVPSPNRAASDNSLAGVTCVNTPVCLGVGSWRDSDGGPQALAEWQHNDKWQVLTTPSTGTERSLLSSVSCVSSTQCFAVGTAGSGGPEGSGGFAQALIEKWDGTAWSLVTPPPVPGAAVGVLTSVSCGAVRSCVAVGYQEAATGSATTLIERFNGETWQVMSSPNPNDQDSVLNGVSCVSASRCVAVGSNSGIGIPQSLVETFNGTSWSITSSANTGFAGNVFYNMGANVLNSVSCSSAINCEAVGTYIDENRIPQALVETSQDEGEDWAPAASAGGARSGDVLFGISCAATTRCAAVGSEWDGALDHVLNENWDGSSWFVSNVADRFAGRNSLNAVSCTTPVACVGVGHSGALTGANETLVMAFAPTPPTAPTAVVAVAGDGEATIAFAAPSDNGGAAISNNTVSATDLTDASRGGQSATGPTSPITVTGLTAGDRYQFTVTATTVFGTSPDSTPSQPVDLRGLHATKFKRLTLRNGWTPTPFGTSDPAAGSAFGIVYLKGAMSNGAPKTAFVLPVAMRPPTDVYVPVDLCNAANGRLHIKTDGAVVVQAEDAFSDAQCFTSLDGVEFALSAAKPLTLKNGWTNSPLNTSAAAVVSVSGAVYLKGAITTTHNNPTPFVVPAGFRPLTTVVVSVDLCHTHHGSLRIDPAGIVTVETNNEFASAQCMTSLDGVSYSIIGSQPLALENSWSGAASVTAANGIVHFSGAISNGSDATLFTLPAALHPATVVYIPIDLCNGENGRLDIGTDGVTSIETFNPFSDAQCQTSLDGASFSPAALP